MIPKIWTAADNEEDDAAGYYNIQAVADYLVPFRRWWTVILPLTCLDNADNYGARLCALTRCGIAIFDSWRHDASMYCSIATYRAVPVHFAPFSSATAFSITLQPSP